MLQKIFITRGELFSSIDQWPNDGYGIDSITTRYTILDISEENDKIEEEEKGPNHTYLN